MQTAQHMHSVHFAHFYETKGVLRKWLIQGEFVKRGAERQLPKLSAGVRFPAPAPKFARRDKKNGA
jgi:hypothetical protein